MGSRLEANSTNVRKRIENHKFEDEGGEEYEASKFGGFTDYMRRKKIKLQNLDSELRSQSTKKPPIFRGIVAQVNGYTQPSLNDLHHLIVSHGGGFLQYLDGKTAVTHIIASSLTPKKKEEFARYRIVKPAWVVDSIKEGRLLPWDAYRVVDEGVRQKVLGFQDGQVVSQTNTQRTGYRDQTDTSWYTSQIKQISSAEVEASNAASRETIETCKQSGSSKCELPGSPVADQRFDVSESFNQDAVELVNDAVEPSHDQVDGSGAFPRRYNKSPSQSGQPNVDESVVLQRDTERLLGPESSPNTTPERGPVNPTSMSSEKRKLTAEEHNAILLSDPHLAQSSTANPDFLNQYYRESRLHHLSTWKAELKSQLQAQAQEKSSQLKAKRIPGARRYVMHVDFDSFFAAVSLRKHPELVDKPVVIAHGSGPGSEIASCNYPARKFGVKNGMWMKTALQLCPDVKVLPYDFKAYEEASRHFYEAILAVDGIVQSISIDEALVDVSRQCIEAGGSDGKAVQEGSIFREQARACELAEQIRALVKDQTGCAVSVGLGNNILLAKVALRKAKPAGQHLIKPEDILDFIGELAVTDLPSVAYSLGAKLEELGVKFVKDIRTVTKERLVNHLGPKTGEKMYEYSRGIDKVEVGEQVVRKSVSAEVNWGIRFVTQQQAEEFVQCLCDELSKRLLEQTVKGKQLTMKIMRRTADAPMDPPKNLGHGKCDTFNKSMLLGMATNDRELIGKEALSILRGFGFSPGELRGLGVQMTKLEPLKPTSTSLPSLFDSSQRRLQFKKPQAQPVTKDKLVPGASKLDGKFAVPTESTLARSSSTLMDDPDPIEDSESPHKSRSRIRGALENARNGDGGPQSLLNVGGTQFVLPTQIDPSVLAELPGDVRTKLAPWQKHIVDSLAPTSRGSVVVKSRSASPHSDLQNVLPNQSQLDPEILAALPEDVRIELLAQYDSEGGSSRATRKNQQLLPQSPRKLKPVSTNKMVMTTPTKKHKMTSLLSKGRSKASSSSTSTLMQSNFVGLHGAKSNGITASDAEATDERVSESFLAELPEDIRAEIIADQKRIRMKTKSGLNIGTAKRRKPTAVDAAGDDTLVAGQRRLRLLPLPAKPTFTSRKLSALSELREAMNAWVEAFSDESEEGPYEEDTAALAVYLEKVISDERDTDKAVSVVKWLAFVVADAHMGQSQASQAWQDVLHRLEATVQKAVEGRGMAPIDFGDKEKVFLACNTNAFSPTIGVSR